MTDYNAIELGDQIRLELEIDRLRKECEELCKERDELKARLDAVREVVMSEGRWSEELGWHVRSNRVLFTLDKKAQ